MKREETVRSDELPSTLLSLRDSLHDGTLSLAAYLDRLEQRFRQVEPQIHAFVPEEGRFARLRREAEQLEERYPQPAARPPLFGVAVGVKDIFHVQGLPTRAGTRLPVEALQGAEAAVVTALKHAGVLILGKTVTTEFAYFAPGPTRNPHNLAHTPGGSSSGSAAAVAAGLSPLALGTQTIGSLIRPAAFCGVVAFKPSYERISRDGVIPVSPSLDHVGFFTHEVAGAAHVAALLCAEWEQPVVPARPIVGIPEGPYLDKASPAGLRHFRRSCRRLREAGFAVKTVPALAEFAALDARHRQLMAAEAARVHEAWFADYDHLYRAKTAELITKGQLVPAEAAAFAREGRVALRQELEALMAEHQIDLWVAPAAPGPAPAGLESTGDPVLNLPWTYAGLPVVNIPAGTTGSGLPLAVQLVGGWYRDEALLLWAEEIAAVLATAERHQAGAGKQPLAAS
jgi:Asp-tRNA(Asn)/Glu-tRNA(Gln) amidotransferase A subunit family amidase